jgi:hypothetical protein
MCIQQKSLGYIWSLPVFIICAQRLVLWVVVFFNTRGTKKMCSISVSQNQIVTVRRYFVLQYTDSVNVVYRTRQGYKHFRHQTFMI